VTVTAKQQKKKPIRKIDLKSPLEAAYKMVIEAYERETRGNIQLLNSAWAGAMQAAVESMERSVKGIVALALHEVPVIHRMTADYNIKCLKKLRTQLGDSEADRQLFIDCAQALVWAYAWSSLHEINQWAFDDIPVTTRELFNENDAKTALDYADRCAQILNSLIRRLASEAD